MARKVNTKFVIGLSVAICSVSAVFMGVYARNYFRRHDPEYFKGLAEEAIKSGNKMDAGRDLFQAASLMRDKHLPGADEVFSRSADIFMEVSREAKTQDDARIAYQGAMEARKQALIENPRNKQVNAALLEDEYKDAQATPHPVAWNEVESAATSLIKTSDSIKPRVYRGEARLWKVLMAASTGKPATPDSFAGVDEDVAAALKMDPGSGPAVALAAFVMQAKALQDGLLRGLHTNKDFMEDQGKKNEQTGEYIREPFPRQIEKVRKYLEDYLAQHPGQGDVAFRLAQLRRLQYEISSSTDKQALEDSIKYGQQAVAAFPNEVIDRGLGDFLAENYLSANRREDAEGVYKKIIEAAKDQPVGYYGLAQLYMRLNDMPKAIESFKDVVRNPKIGIERDAVRNTFFQMRSMEMIAWLNLDLVEENANPADNPARLKESADYTDRLRTSHAPRGIVDLLDGRAQFLSHNIPQAVTFLRRAEANLSSNRQLLEDYRRTEFVLASVNLAQGQAGGALACYEKILEINPDDFDAVLRKGRVLLQLARVEEARLLMERYLGRPDSIVTPAGTEPASTKVFPNADRLPPQFVKSASSIWNASWISGAGKGKLPDMMERDSAVYLQMALAAANSDDYDTAASNAEKVLEKEDQNPPPMNQSAYQTAIIANVQLKQRDAAKSLAQRALAKYPKNTTFQYLSASLDAPTAASTPAEQRKLVEASITDEFTKQMTLASIFQQEKDWDNAIKALLKAEDQVKGGATPEERDRYAAVIDRTFLCSIIAANASKGNAKAEADYYGQAQNCVIKADKLNQDGTGGLLYRGRLEFIKSDGKNGMDFLRQAVASHPDLASAHFVLGQAYFQLAMIAARNSAGGGEAAAVMNSNKASALEEFRKVLQLAPNNLRAIQFAVEILVSNGDSTSIKEAQQWVDNGLMLSPKSAYFINASEILSRNLPVSIKRREDMLAEGLKKNPEDNSPEAIDNRRRLAILYMRQKEELGTTETVKEIDRARAVELIDWAWQRNKTDALLADTLAHYLMEDMRVVDQASLDNGIKTTVRALGIYDNFVNSDKPDLQFVGLLAKGEFLHRVAIPMAVYYSLYATPEKYVGPGKKLFTAEDQRSEAVAIFKKAIELEPKLETAKGSNEAERRLGDLYFDMNNMVDAEQVYAQVLEREKDSVIRERVQRRYVEVEIRLPIPQKAQERTHLADAIKRLDEVIKKDPRDVQALVLRAFACLQQESVEERTPEQKPLLASSMDYLNRALAIDPNNSDALYYRALTNVRTSGEHLDDAIRDLVMSAKGDRSSVKAQMLLASIYRRSHRYEEAAIEYQEVLSQQPELLAARMEYADFLMSVAQQLRTLPSESSEEFVISIRRLDPEGKLYELIKKSADLYPAQPKWRFMYGQLLALQEKNPEALRFFEAVYSALPYKDLQVSDAYLEMLCRTGENAKAIDVATKLFSEIGEAVNKQPEASVFFVRRAAAYKATGKEKECIADLDRAFEVAAVGIKDHNYNPFVRTMSVAVDALSGRDAAPETRANIMKMVVERLQARLAAKPDEAISKIALMQMYLLLKQPNDALKVAQTTTPPAEDLAMRVLVLRQLALTKYQAQQYVESEKDFKELLTLVPKDIESLNNYAFMLADAMNQPQQAIDLIQKAIKVLNTEVYENQVTTAYASIYDTLGWAKFKAGDFQGAASAIQSSVQTQPSSDAYYHLARAYQRTGNLPGARLMCAEGIKFAKKRNDPILSELMTFQATLP